MIIIFNRKYYKNEKYWTPSDKTTYYICKKCGFHQEFNINEIISNVGVFLAYFVEGDDIKRVKEMEEGNQRCIFCDSETKPPKPAKNELSEHAILKLFVKPKKRFLGYFCKVCRRAYYLPIRITKWEKSEYFKRKERVELLRPLSGQLIQADKEKHPLYDKNLGIITDNRYLDCIGGFTTTSGFPSNSDNDTTYTIQIRKSKINRIMKYLQKQDVRIIR